MSARAGTIGGVPARVMRVSFTGELSYEINVPARHGLALWDAVRTIGAEHDITPLGTEALHVLRAEKGYIAVGHETDGTVNPVRSRSRAARQHEERPIFSASADCGVPTTCGRAAGNSSGS